MYFYRAFNSFYFTGIDFFTYSISYMVILIFKLYTKNKAYVQMEPWEYFRGLGWGKVVCEVRVISSFVLVLSQLAVWPPSCRLIQTNIMDSFRDWGTIFWRCSERSLCTSAVSILHNGSASFTQFFLLFCVTITASP